MKIRIFVPLILLILLISAMPIFAGESVVLPDLPRISVEEVKNKIDKGHNDFVIVDVRDAASYSAGHIKGAVNIYYDATGDPMNRQLTLMSLPMDKLIVTYCDCTDDASSATIADELFMIGYDRDKVKILAGGSLKWVEVKYPMVPSN